MPTPKKLIEVAIPVKEISAESVRDKSIRHGHISTLHLWWARRPLPVCRAVVFASLVPDPLDPHCPQAFCDTVELLLGKAHNPGDPYAPYADIPWTAVYDPMEDNRRNRLQMFIGKFTPDMQQHLLHNSPKPAAGKQLSDHSLIKWDNKNNEAILSKARKLIWVAFNSGQSAVGGGQSAEALLADYDRHYAAIRQAEQDLYSMPDRHLPGSEVQAKEAALHQAIEDFLDKMPRVFDPFAGGGAIPLEAARLGCRSYGNDINPVAHIIQKGSLEFPQKYGKPITYSKEAFTARYGEAAWHAQPLENKTIRNGDATAVRIANRLAFDVEHYARELLRRTEAEIGHFYPANDKGQKPIAYYWARVGTCSNPACRAEVPLLKGFYLCNKPDKKVHLKPVIEGNKIEFEIKNGNYDGEGWLARGNLKCPCCENTTDVKTLKQQFWNSATQRRMLCVIWEGKSGKEYLPPTQFDLAPLEQIPDSDFIPQERLPVTYSKAMAFCGWNFNKWGDLFAKRELLAINTLRNTIEKIEIDGKTDYQIALKTYLTILFNRVVSRLTMFGIWHTSRETLEHPFGKSAIQMVFDYPESNPFAESGGGALSQLDWITRYIESESASFNITEAKNAASGDKSQFPDRYLTAVVTDPPYYDAVAYADLSDFFYVWMKVMLRKEYPLTFSTPLSPKNEECTALKHHREESKDKAKLHFEGKLLEIFSAIQSQTSEVVSIMYAHQSTEAWTTLCNSILGASMNITGSWAVDTEMTSALKVGKAFLSSSVTVSCRPAQRRGIGEYRTVRKAIEGTVEREVKKLYALGFRGADLLTACFGQAVSEFGQYQKVEKADGSEVSVAELLEMARESAFNALLKGFEGDDGTKFYIGWLQLYGFVESDFDDAAKFSRVGLSIDVQELFNQHILLKNGNKQTLGGFRERIAADRNLGERAANLLIDEVHRAMHLYQGADRKALLRYIGKVAAGAEGTFWRVLAALCEVLPDGSEDFKQASGLRTNKDSLIRESKALDGATPTQGALF